MAPKLIIFQLHVNQACPLVNSEQCKTWLMCVQVLEPQNVDPSMVQMTFLDDVVHSLLKGENIGITSRRRSRSSQNNSAHVSIWKLVWFFYSSCVNLVYCRFMTTKMRLFVTGIHFSISHS